MEVERAPSDLQLHSGILSAHTLLIAKSAVELIVRSVFDRANQFNRWQSWVILLGLVLFALTQLYYLHCGLRLCSTSILYPLCFCVYNITAILDGLIYFQQTSRIPHLYAAMVSQIYVQKRIPSRSQGVFFFF